MTEVKNLPWLHYINILMTNDDTYIQSLDAPFPQEEPLSVSPVSQMPGDKAPNRMATPMTQWVLVCTNTDLES
jgi:hypothetical protein